MLFFTRELLAANLAVTVSKNIPIRGGYTRICFERSIEPCVEQQSCGLKQNARNYIVSDRSLSLSCKNTLQCGSQYTSCLMSGRQNHFLSQHQSTIRRDRGICKFSLSMQERTINPWRVFFCWHPLTANSWATNKDCKTFNGACFCNLRKS